MFGQTGIDSISMKNTAYPCDFVASQMTIVLSSKESHLTFPFFRSSASNFSHVGCKTATLLSYRLSEEKQMAKIEVHIHGDFLHRPFSGDQH